MYIKITRKFITVFLIGVFCLFILLITGYEINNLNNENNIELLDNDTNKILQDINYQAFSKTDEIAKALASDIYIRQLCLKKDPISFDKSVIILNSVLETSNIDLSYVMDLNGIVVASSQYKEDRNLDIKGKDFSFRPYFLDAVKGKNVIYPALGTQTKSRGVYFSSPVRDTENNIIGVVTCKVNMGLIDTILKQYSHKIFISTEDGIVFSTNMEKELYKSICPISTDKLENIKKSKQFPGVSIKPLNLSLNKKTAVLDAKSYYFSQKSIGDNGWRLLALSDFHGNFLLLPMQFRFIIIIIAILIVLIFTIIVLVKDIFKRRESETTLKKLFQAVEQASSTIVITDIKGVIEYINPKFTELTGYSAGEAIGKNIKFLKSKEHDNDFYKKMWTIILSGEDWRGSLCNRKKNGELYWEDDHISSVKDAKGRITNFIAIKEDVTKRRDYEERLNKYATMDEMTGTFNRRSAMLLMEKQMNIAKRQNQSFVIFFMDINGLKSVNDTLGHNFGDELITSAVNSIKASLREIDSLCRLGGDEFLIILPNTNIKQAEVILSRIHEEVIKINREERFPFILSLSFGESEFTPDSDLTLDTLIHMADQKMYENKAQIKQKQGANGIFRNS